MTKMVHCKCQFVSIFSYSVRREHDPGIVDQHVYLGLLSENALTELSHGRQGGQVQLAKQDQLAPAPLSNVRDGSFGAGRY